MYGSYSFTTSARDGVSGQRHAPAALHGVEEDRFIIISSSSSSSSSIVKYSSPTTHHVGEVGRGVTVPVHSLPRQYMGVSGQRHAPAAL
jgi:hypothetical protein